MGYFCFIFNSVVVNNAVLEKIKWLANNISFTFIYDFSCLILKFEKLKKGFN